jgi:hypothetical protein
VLLLRLFSALFRSRRPLVPMLMACCFVVRRPTLHLHLHRECFQPCTEKVARVSKFVSFVICIMQIPVMVCGFMTEENIMLRP